MNPSKSASYGLSRHVVAITVLTVLYTMLGAHAITSVTHPYLVDAIIAFNMCVVVFAGIMYGRYTGAVVGLLGALISAMSLWAIPTPGFSPMFDLVSAIPHAVMGYCAGYIAERNDVFLASLTIIIGHALNLLMFSLFGLFSLSDYTAPFWQAILYETLIDSLLINVGCNLYLVSFPVCKNRW